MVDSPPRALVVDDNVALARVTQFALENAGIVVSTAVNGREALEAATREVFDIVITDQQMPEKSGLDLCRALRAMPQYAQTPLVLLTAKGLELELPKLRAELGINEIFSKPFSPAEVVETARRLTAVAM